MADITRFQRISDPASPNRCQAIGGPGGNQCGMVAVEGSKYCPIHASKAAKNQETKQVRNYRLTQWQARMEEFADNQQVKSLREEIGIMRMLLEEIIGCCQNATELILYSGKIADLVTRIEKLVVSCHRLEASTGLLLDKAAALQLAGSMVSIIGQHVKDEIAIDAISDEIIRLITEHNQKAILE